MQRPFPCKMSIIFTAGFLLLVTMAACSIGKTLPVSSEGPTVTISHPRQGQVFLVEEVVPVKSSAVSEMGIQRIELWIDGNLTRVDVNPDLGSSYVVSQPWQSKVPGEHLVSVKAFDTDGSEGQSDSVKIRLVEDNNSGRAPASPTSPDLAEKQAENTTETPLDTPPPFPQPACTPPLCEKDEVYYCPDDCPSGCGTQCATPTVTGPHTGFEETGIETHPTLKSVWEKPEVTQRLGYPISDAIADHQYARQYFERGFLFWWNQSNGDGLIWAIEIPEASADQGLRWIGPFEDSWNGQEPYSCDAAKKTRYGPVAGFGKLWCDNPEIAAAIGNAQDLEQGTGESSNYAVVQLFQGGSMLYSPIDNEVWILFDGGAWKRYHPEG